MRPKIGLAAAACLLFACIAVRLSAQNAPPPAPPAGGAQGAAGAPGQGAGGAPAGRAGRAGGGGGGGGGATFPAQQRPPADAAVVARGKALFGINCVSCHGADLRGGDQGGPNLLRSQVVLDDKDGELISPIVHGSRQAQGMDPIDLPEADVHAVATYVHSVAATMQGQGGPPRGSSVPTNEQVLVGNVAAGQTYFTAHCSTCHSVTGDLQGIGGRNPDVRNLQNSWVSGTGGAGGRGGGGRGGRGGGAGGGVTVTVTMPNGQKIEGDRIRMDDFLVVVGLPDQTERTIARNGDVPKVEVHDPGEAHRKIILQLSDKDMHDVTAYLASIK